MFQKIAEALRAMVATGKVPGLEDFGADFVEPGKFADRPIDARFMLVAPDGGLYVVMVKKQR